MMEATLQNGIGNTTTTNCTLLQKSLSKLDWTSLGGALPCANPKLFGSGEFKLSKKLRPQLVVDVPQSEEEKCVKVLPTPICLNYLKNNWIWHRKNGNETSTSSNSRKRRSAEPADAAANEARARVRYRRFQQLLMEMRGEREGGRVEGEDEADSAALELVEDQNRIRRMRRDILLHQIEQDEEGEEEEGEERPRAVSTSTPSTSNSGQSSTEDVAKRLRQSGLETGEDEQPQKQWVLSMAARAMEEEEPMEDAGREEPSNDGNAQAPAPPSAPLAIRRRSSNAGRVGRTPIIEEEQIGEAAN